MNNPFDQFDLVSPLVGMPANGFKYSPAQMAQLNAARDSLRAAEQRGEPYTYNAQPEANPFDQFDKGVSAPNADAALGGTLQLGIPFTGARLDTGIPLPASAEAALVGAGKTTARLLQGARQLLPGSNAALDQQVAADNAAVAPLEQAHPLAMTAGEIAPYFATGNPAALAALSGLEYGTPTQRAERAGMAYGGAKIGQVVGRMFGPQSMAPVANDAADFAEYGLNAGNKFGIPLRMAQTTDSVPVKIIDSVAANLPVSSAVISKAKDASYQGFNRAVGKTFGADTTQITPELLGQYRGDIGSTIGDIASRNQIAMDRPLFSGLQDAVKRAASELEPSERPIVLGQIQKIFNAVDPQTGTIPGTQYKALQSKMGEIGKNRGGTISSIMYDTRAAMRDAMTRSVSPDDAAAWLKANHDYFNVQQVADAAKSTPGSLSPTQLLQAVNRAQTQAKFGGGNDLAELAQFAKPVLGDTIPNSGTAQRLFYQRMLTNPLTTIGSIGGAAYGANELGINPLDAAAGGLLAYAAARGMAGKPASEGLRRILQSSGAGLLSLPVQ